MRIAIPRMGEMVAPCFEYCSTMAVFTLSESGALDQVDFPLLSRDPFDRVRLLKDQKVDALICGGMQAVYEDLLRASGFLVISWVSGRVEDLLDMYLRGQLVPGTELPPAPGRSRRGPDQGALSGGHTEEIQLSRGAECPGADREAGAVPGSVRGDSGAR